MANCSPTSARLGLQRSTRLRGKVLWTNLDEALVVMHENGPGSSPVVWKDKLIFHLDGSDEQSIVALDVATGQVAWKTARTGKLNRKFAAPQKLRHSAALPAPGWIDGNSLSGG